MPNLYMIQDDRPLYVVANSFQTALELWRLQIEMENGCDCSNENPDGIAFCCSSEELLIPELYGGHRPQALLETGSDGGGNESQPGS